MEAAFCSLTEEFGAANTTKKSTIALGSIQTVEFAACLDHQVDLKKRVCGNCRVYSLSVTPY